MVLRTVPNAPPLVLLQNVCECILKLFVRLLVVSRSSNPFKMHHEMEFQFSNSRGHQHRQGLRLCLFRKCELR